MILCLFFTRGVSLKDWVDSGMFYREKLIYEHYLNEKKIKKIFWVTYGYEDDVLAVRLKKDGVLHHSIHILCAPKILSVSRLGSFLYSLLSPFLHASYIKTSNLFKTNQMDGAWSGLIAKKLYRKPLFVRTGYTLSKSTAGLRKKLSEVIEAILFKSANLISVTSNEDKLYVADLYHIHSAHVIPNFVDLKTFKNFRYKRDEKKVLYVGRLDSEKNLFNLIKCISMLDLDLVLYGDGILKDNLRSYAIELGVNVDFRGRVANNQLPLIYNLHRYYVLPSLREGLPKTLMEAMGCGCLCIGTNVSGIKELIKDGETGFLATNPTASELAIAFKRAISAQDDSIVTKSESFIRKAFSLEKVAQLEFGLMCELLKL